MEIKELIEMLFNSATTLDLVIEDVVKKLFDSGMTLDQIIEEVSATAETEDFKRSLNETR